jgi:DNA polymerase III delta subunit
MSQWKRPPPVVILSGGEEFLRVRELKEAIAAADATGRSVEYVKGTDSDEITRIISSNGVFFQEDVLIVVEDPETIDPAVVLHHHEHGDGSVCILLYVEGAIKVKSNLGKIAAELPSKLIAKFEKPKPWEEADAARSFCITEASRKNMTMPPGIAAALVQNAGSDLGVLSFEILKLELLLAEQGGGEISANHLRSSIAAFTELGPKPVIEALEQRDLRGAGVGLANMRRTHAGDLTGATMQLCAFIGHAATAWLHVASLLKTGSSPEEISSRVGQHVFVLRKTSIPSAKRWGEGRLVSLLKSVARVQRAVKGGHVHPWAELEAALFRSLA